MKTLEILDNLFFIQRGYLNANHFVCRTSPAVLVDTGYRDGIDDTLAVIASLGVDVADTGLIINTHCHCDHIGGNRAIQVRSGCQVAMHPVGRHFIDTRDDWSTWWRYYGQAADFFDVTRSLADGEEVRLGDHVFEVIHTPGHAADGLVLYHKKAGVLLSADTLWENDLAVMTLRIEGSDAVFRMLASLERIAALDVRQVFPGHGAPFADAAGAIARAMRRLEGYLADRSRIGSDLLKKIIVYTLLMRKAVPSDDFFDQLMMTRWYQETVDLYFDGADRAKYDEIIGSFLHRGVIRRRQDHFVTTVPP